MTPEGTVFIVDDDPAILKSMARLLAEVAQPSATFQSAREFLEAYDPAQPGCLLVDVRMPGMSGIELHKTLIAQGSKIPVIVITGHGDVPMAAKALRRGAVDFIEKPLEPQQLLDRIQEALARDAQSRRVKADDRFCRPWRGSARHRSRDRCPRPRHATGCRRKTRLRSSRRPPRRDCW